MAPYPDPQDPFATLSLHDQPNPAPIQTPQDAAIQNAIHAGIQTYLNSINFNETMAEVKNLKISLATANSQIEQTEAQLQAAAKGPMTYITTSKPPDPPKFKGAAKDLLPFLHAMEDHMKSSFYRAGSSDFDNVLFFSRFLDHGDPASWHESIRTNAPNLLNDFKAYKEAFTAQFENPHLAKENRRKLSELKQTGSVSAYSVKFKTLAASANIDDDTKIDWYFKGLKATIQDRLNNGDGLPAHFETLVKRASNVDHLMNAVRNAAQGPTYSNPARSHSTSNATPTSAAAPASQTGPWPMDIDSVKSRLVNGKVPSEERARRLKEGLCAYCAGPGHKADDCPSKKARTSQQGKASPQA